MRPPSSSLRPFGRAARAVRQLLAGLVLGGALLSAPAVAAPTCVDNAGKTVRCDAPTALPVGQAPAAEADPAGPGDIPLPAPETLFGLICVLGGLFVLIGLMPDFDDWSEHDGPR